MRIWRCVLAGGVQRSSLSVKRTVPAFTGAEADAAACPATVGVFASTGLGEFRRLGGEQVLRLGAGWGVSCSGTSNFLFCQKKVTKENHLKLRFKTSLARGGFRRLGGELAFPWRGGGLRRPHFFLRRKKCGKESRLDLRSKGPLARCGLCKIGGADLAELVRRVSLSVRGTACTSCAAAADSSEGRGWCAGRVAIIKSRPLRREAPQWVGGG